MTISLTFEKSRHNASEETVSNSTVNGADNAVVSRKGDNFAEREITFTMKYHATKIGLVTIDPFHL